MQETVFKGIDDADVFQTDHIEPRLPVVDIQGLCHITFHIPGGISATAANTSLQKQHVLRDGIPSFRCSYHFDHEQISLTPIAISLNSTG